MKIPPNVQDTVAGQIISVVKKSRTPLGIRETLDLVHQAGSDIPSDVVVALVWQLLANRRLEFSPMRKLSIPAQRNGVHAS